MVRLTWPESKSTDSYSLENDLHAMHKVNPVKLLIVDSIAHFPKLEYGQGMQGLNSRNDLLSREAMLLKYAHIPWIFRGLTEPRQLASDYDLAVLVTNQASRFKDKLNVALGNTWYHSVNTRVLLSLMDDTSRQLSIVKSPLVPSNNWEFTIQRNGISINPQTH